MRQRRRRNLSLPKSNYRNANESCLHLFSLSLSLLVRSSYPRQPPLVSSCLCTHHRALSLSVLSFTDVATSLFCIASRSLCFSRFDLANDFSDVLGLFHLGVSVFDIFPIKDLRTKEKISCLPRERANEMQSYLVNDEV